VIITKPTNLQKVVWTELRLWL